MCQVRMLRQKYPYEERRVKQETGVELEGKLVTDRVGKNEKEGGDWHKERQTRNRRRLLSRERGQKIAQVGVAL